ncbi:hypothetical protein ACFL0C_00555 [Patescibacteria group bacterium]
MKHKWFLLALLGVFVLVACAASGISADAKVQPNSVCPTGVTFASVAVNNPEKIFDNALASNTTFLIIPNEGCAIPMQFCTFVKSGYGGGLSCVDIK